MKRKIIEEYVWEVGDICYDKMHELECEVMYILANKETNNIVVRHTGDNSDFLTIKSADELQPLKTE